MINILMGNHQQLMSIVNGLITKQKEQEIACSNLRCSKTLTDILYDALDKLGAQLGNHILLARSACQSHNTIVIGSPFPKENNQPVSVMEYYGCLEIEKDHYEKNYWVIKAPMFSGDHLDWIHLHTFPMCKNQTKHLVLYQPLSFRPAFFDF